MAGIELFFFLVAGVLPCFGFRMRTVLITHQCFLAVAEQCLYRAKDFSVSCAALPARRLGVHKELGGDRTRTSDPGWPREVPHHVVLRWTIKMRELAREGCCCWRSG